MNRYRWLALAILATFVGCVATAQAPDCTLSRRVRENYWGDAPSQGFTAPRYVHHAIRVSLTVTGAELAHLAFHTRPLPSGAIGFGVMQAPHLRDVLTHRPVGGRDAIADAAVSSLPEIVLVGRSGHSWQATALTVTAVAAVYLAAACWESP